MFWFDSCGFIFSILFKLIIDKDLVIEDIVDFVEVFIVGCGLFVFEMLIFDDCFLID